MKNDGFAKNDPSAIAAKRLFFRLGWGGINFIACPSHYPAKWCCCALAPRLVTNTIE